MIDESIEAKRHLYNESGSIKKAVEAIKHCFRSGNKVLIFGNGGSAADSQHMAAEFVGRYKKERKGLPAIALTTDSSILTAWSNDYTYETIFERQVESLAKKGDVLIGLSTSGNSKNVIKAMEKGKELGTINISLTGKKGGKLKETSDININVESDNTPRIQECHLLAYHIICELVEEDL
ncbi:D-sedoheptulose 7-phosphate isomerase [Candidatus Woesearchaeota archaeon]|nr:D-sedoheptulose 7-phosphate isomerase [Candidatus Woesearchaeota archaeon]